MKSNKEIKSPSYVEIVTKNCSGVTNLDHIIGSAFARLEKDLAYRDLKRKDILK